MSNQHLVERLAPDGPKRILSLDGGGIRGALTLGYLERIEHLLQRRCNRPTLRLCEYFDLIGGTSTGAIMAAALAIGMDVASVRRMYLDLGGAIFKPINSGFTEWLQKLALLHPDPRLEVQIGPLEWRFGGNRRWIARFDPAPLEEHLENVFGDRTLGDSSIRTGYGLGLAKLSRQARQLREMSEAENRYNLDLIGKAAANRDVRDEHFPAAFDLAVE